MPSAKSKPAPKPAPAQPAAGSDAKALAVSRALKPGDHLFLVDGSGYIFRAYHALPPLTRKSDGLQVNAVLGFCNMLWKLLQEMPPDNRPTHLAVVFDKSEKTFRSAMYGEYKANRSAPPDDLIPQFPLIREAVRAFDIPCLEQAGFEADDLIATYARLACEAKATTTIVSSDKDLMQLVCDTVMLYDTMKDKRIGASEVFEKFGVTPDKVIEVQSLIGDSSDNVPGVPGIGVKTAAQLIIEYGDLETLLARAGEIKQEKRRQALIEHAENARLSKKLVTLDQNVKLDVPVADLAVHEPDYKNLIAFLKAMEFNALTRRVAEKGNVEPGGIEADPKLISGEIAITSPPPSSSSPSPLRGRSSGEAGRERGQARFDLGDLPPPQPSPASGRGSAVAEPGPTPISLAERRIEALRSAKFEHAQYETIATLDRLEHWIARAYDTGFLALKTELSSIDPMQAKLCGIALAVTPNEAAYLPIGHREAGDESGANAGLFAPKLCAGQISEQDALTALKPILEDLSVIKIGHNVKQDWLVLACRAVRVGAVDDTMLMSYVLDAGKGAHDMDSLVNRYFGRSPSRFNDVKNKERALLTAEATPIARTASYAAEDADATLRLWQALKPRMVAERVATVYATLEQPLPQVLARMEERGISIDQAVLARPLAGVRQETGRAGAGDQQDRRSAGQSGKPQTARRYPVRTDGPAGRHQNQDRTMVDWRACARRARRDGSQAAASHPGLAAGIQAALDLYRGAAHLRQSADQARAHVLRAGGDQHRPPVVIRAEPAEHPDSHRGGPQDSPRLRGSAGQEAGLR